MLKILLEIWQSYGIDAVQLGVICWFCWKFLTNHWRHFKEDFDEMRKEIKINKRAIDRLSNRISKIEGKIDN
jgi:hypothetical protein